MLKHTRILFLLNIVWFLIKLIINYFHRVKCKTLNNLKDTLKISVLLQQCQ